MARNLNYVADLEDEVALEGLDGITIEGLWLRLQHRPNFETNMNLDENSKNFLWCLIVRDEEIFMYQLPTPRNELTIFNRYEHMDHELGIVLEPEETPEEIYPFHPIDDQDSGVRGSCAAYKERVDVTEKATAMTLQDVEKIYGRRLVLVASQLLRDKALNISTCIDKFYDLTLTQYIILERIGRSRHMGEITQGKVSLAAMGENPKSMFYHRKRLLKLNLITKQPHQQKGVKGQTHNGSLLHLTRFYVERRSKFIMMIQRAVEILKNKPNHCAPYTQIKEEMGMPETSCRKLFKSIEFQRYVRNLSRPYRKVFPDAQPAQWRCKGKDMERFVRIMELINPGVDPLEVCKVDEVAEEEEDEGYPGILDQSKIVWRQDMLQQAYRIVEDAGPEGVTQSDMARMLGQTKLDSRTICRNLQRCNTVHSLMKDVGRQRVSRYVSHKYAKTGHLTQEFRKERQKMIAMIEEDKPQIQTTLSSSDEHELSRTVESDLLEGVEVNLEMVTSKKAKEEPSPASTSHTSTPTSTRHSRQGEKKKHITEKQTCNEGFLSLLKEMRMTYSNQKRNSPHVTTRMMKRANMIIEAVRSVRVIDDAFKLQKMIVQAESKEGYAVKMDKKSLDRLLDKLAKGGFLKNIIVKLKSKSSNMTKQVRYVVHPSITFESPHLISTIDQQKLKFLAGGSEAKKEPDGGGTDKKQSTRWIKIEERSEGLATMLGGAGGQEQEEAEAMNRSSVGESMHELKLMHHIVTPKSPDSSDVPSSYASVRKLTGLKGNLGPKFVRMCELHKLLFYLVYGYEGHEDLCQEDAWVTIAASAPEVNLQNEDMTEYPNIYCPKLSWKMFIPPLPNHMNTESGWAFVCDILLRLPLCIFIRLVSVPCSSHEIESFLSHPLKKNLLVKYLPPHLRQSLLQGRRYVTYVIDLINRLCYMGLLQYGQQIMKEKDQVFIYVNHRASLIDSTTSSPGYHQISADKEYVRKEYYFSGMQDIQQYWYDLWTISMHTPLGGHNCMQGKKITIQILDRKPQIMETLTPRNTREAPLRDNGSIPGDGRGAGGLDSAMFAHLKRNWSSSTSGQSAVARPSALLPPSGVAGERSTYEGSASYSQYLMNTTNPSTDTLSPKHRLAGLRNVKLSVYKPHLGPDGKSLDVQVGLVTRQPRGRKRKREECQSPNPEKVQVRSLKMRGSGRNRPTSYQRELKQRKKSPKKPYYDEEDRAALRRMNKLRVDWTSAEDSFLLLCKVASCFLFPNLRSQMITFSLVRDLLHERFPEARNKTSRACQRRINYIMKNKTTEDNVAIFLEEVRQDASIVAEFKSPKLPRNKKNLEDVYSKIFRQLMSRLVVKFASGDSRQCPDLPDSAEEFRARYQVIMASSSLRSKLQTKEVTSVSDIDFHVVNALIYSSLCSKYDRDSYAYQLYLAYQQYPQTLLNSVLTRMRHDQMISYKKCYNRSVFAQTCLPLSTSPFQLSVTYHYVFNFKYQFEIFNQAWQILKQLLEQKHHALLTEKQTAQDITGSEEPAASSSTTPEAGTKTKYGHHHDGVPIVIHHEGGYCAAIVALMATKRLIFDIVIPEQIIMMDQQQPILQDHHHSLLQRFSDHTEMSGRDVQEFSGTFSEQSKKSSGASTMPASATSLNAQETDVIQGDTGLLDKKVDIDSLKRKAFEKDIHKVKGICTAGEMPRQEDTSSDASLTCEHQSEGEIKVNDIQDSIRKSTSEREPSQELQEKQEFSLISTKHVGSQETEVEDDNEDTHDTEDSFLHCVGSSIEENLDGTEPQSRTNLPSASRLGLYMMRDQLTLAEVDQINIQHAQEHLVVNACEVSCRLRPPPDLQEEYESAVAVDLEMADDILLPLSKGIVSDALEQRKKVTLQEWNQLDEVLARWQEQGENADLLEMVREVHQYIDRHKEIGASVKQLKDAFGDYPYNITAVVALMEGALLLLRVGVAVVRWVTIQHTKPWLIHTNKITRVNRQSVRVQGVYRMNLDETEKGSASSTCPTVSNTTIDASEEKNKHSQDNNSPPEGKQDPVSIHSETPPSTSTPDTADSTVEMVEVGSVEAPQEGKEIEIQRETPAPDSETEPAEQPTETPNTGPEKELYRNANRPIKCEDVERESATSRRSIRISQYSTTRTGEDEAGASHGARHIHSSHAMRKRNYRRDEEVSSKMEKAVKQHHHVSEHERIDVAVRPWVRLNGTLNRRVVDRLLGAVLSLVMERPGISGRDVVCRFSPALQPAHTHDLLETLVQLQCVMRVLLVCSHKPSLFAGTVEYNLVLAEVHDCDDDMLYEPAVDAVLKLAMFIGDKKYSQDFLSGERRV